MRFNKIIKDNIISKYLLLVTSISSVFLVVSLLYFIKGTYSDFNGSTGNLSIRYVLTYYINFDELTDSVNVTIKEGTDYVVLDNMWTVPIGYKFSGWIDEAGNLYNAGDIIKLYDKLDLYAKWDLVEYDDEIDDDNSDNIDSSENDADTDNEMDNSSDKVNNDKNNDSQDKNDKEDVITNNNGGSGQGNSGNGSSNTGSGNDNNGSNKGDNYTDLDNNLNDSDQTYEDEVINVEDNIDEIISDNDVVRTDDVTSSDNSQVVSAIMYIILEILLVGFAIWFSVYSVMKIRKNNI